MSDDTLLRFVSSSILDFGGAELQDSDIDWSYVSSSASNFCGVIDPGLLHCESFSIADTDFCKHLFFGSVNAEGACPSIGGAVIIEPEIGGDLLPLSFEFSALSASPLSDDISSAKSITRSRTLTRLMLESFRRFSCCGNDENETHRTILSKLASHLRGLAQTRRPFQRLRYRKRISQQDRVSQARKAHSLKHCATTILYELTNRFHSLSSLKKYLRKHHMRGLKSKKLGAVELEKILLNFGFELQPATNLGFSFHYPSLLMCDEHYSMYKYSNNGYFENSSGDIFFLNCII